MSSLHEFEVGIPLPWAPAKNPAGGSVASLDRSGGAMRAKACIEVASKHATLVSTTLLRRPAPRIGPPGWRLS